MHAEQTFRTRTAAKGKGKGDNLQGCSDGDAADASAKPSIVFYRKLHKLTVMVPLGISHVIVGVANE